jgi:hypothetical protein
VLVIYPGIAQDTQLTYPPTINRINLTMKNLILQPKSSTEPFLQQVIRSGYDFPFTMNPTIGCFYGACAT